MPSNLSDLKNLKNLNPKEFKTETPQEAPKNEELNSIMDVDIEQMKPSPDKSSIDLNSDVGDIIKKMIMNNGKEPPALTQAKSKIEEQGFDANNPSDLAKMAENGECNKIVISDKNGEKITKYEMPDGTEYIVKEYPEKSSGFWKNEKTPGHTTVEVYDPDNNLIQSGRYEDNGNFSLSKTNEDGSKTTVNYSSYLDCECEGRNKKIDENTSTLEQIIIMHSHTPEDNNYKLEISTTSTDGKTKTTETIEYDYNGNIEKEGTETDYDYDSDNDAKFKDQAPKLGPAIMPYVEKNYKK